MKPATCHPEKKHRALGLCSACWARQDRAKNVERERARERERYRRNPPRQHQTWRYGITQSEYQTLLDKQGGVCAICREMCPSGNRLAIDHEHESGRVRGLLCGRCNPGLGMFRDDPDLLARAATYLKEAT